MSDKILYPSKSMSYLPKRRGMNKIVWSQMESISFCADRYLLQEISRCNYNWIARPVDSTLTKKRESSFWSFTKGSSNMPRVVWAAGNPKLVSDLNSTLDSKSYHDVPMSNWWAIQPYVLRCRKFDTVEVIIICYSKICNQNDLQSKFRYLQIRNLAFRGGWSLGAARADEKGRILLVAKV